MYSANKKEVHTKDVPVHEKDQSKANKKEVHTKDVPVHEKDQKVRPRYSEGPTMLEGV